MSVFSAGRTSHQQRSAADHPPAINKQRQLFVDNVRFWSMLAIVAVHGGTAFGLHGRTPGLLSQIVVTPWKFGTIDFFLISGFLLGDRIETCSPLDYLRRRMRRMLLPWLWWACLLTVALFVREPSTHATKALFSYASLAMLGHSFVFCLTATPFWFVPNMLVALSILLLFRSHIDSLRLGALLFAISLFYGINIYTHWVPSGHTTALFGFVFYLWLGAFASRHYAAISTWIARLRTEVLVAGVLLTGLCALAESRLIQRVAAGDALNSLRFSNQLFSIAVILLIARFDRAAWPRFIDVRLHTYGIYLTHCIIMMSLFKMLKDLSNHLPAALFSTGAGVLFLWAGVSAATYVLSLAIAKIAAHNPGLQWMIGAAVSRPQPTSQPVLTYPAENKPQLVPPRVRRTGRSTQPA